MDYAYKRELTGDFDEILTRVKESLQQEGFGVLTEIDVQKTMKEKIDAEYQEYMILGACNPVFANKVLHINKDIGLLLPCNVLVYKNKDSIYVSAILPTVIMNKAEDQELNKLAEEVESKLVLAINNI